MYQVLDHNVSSPQFNVGGSMVRNGGMPSSTKSIRTSDFRDFRRPFICPRTGLPSVLVNKKDKHGNIRYTTNKGVKTFLRESMPIMQAINSGYNVPIGMVNAAMLRPEQYSEIDKAVIKASRQPLVAYEDMRSANSYSGFDAYGRMILEYQAMSDPGEAVEDFDLQTAARHDQPLFLNRATPLPCTHADFYFSDRFMQISGQDGYEGVDTLTAEAMTARVSERIEDVTIGQVTGATYGTISAGSHTHQGTSTVYGMANFTYRTNKTNLTTPTGANPQATVIDVLAMIQTLKALAFQGPFMLYNSLSWDQYLDNDYAFTNGSNWAASPGQTLRERLKAIPAIQDVKTLPRWSAPIMSGGSAGTYAFLLIDWKKAGRAIDGRPPTVLQWDSMGGMRHNFKVWAIQVPQMFAEYSTNCALVYATTS